MLVSLRGLRKLTRLDTFCPCIAAPFYIQRTWLLFHSYHGAIYSFLLYLQGKFTTKSDVWSFAVTLWEILTFAREQPFERMTDEEVISNAGHYYRNDGEHVYLPHPPICPKEIYDLMCECWNRQESERPSFREIHMFLSRKNMGYDPRKDNLDHVS